MGILVDITTQTVSSQFGPIQFPGPNVGSSEVTVSLETFQTTVFKNVLVESARTTDLRVKVTAGQVTETVPGGGVR